ncbi:hypothetical protein D3C85_1299660 [compost metagenome]
MAVHPAAHVEGVLPLEQMGNAAGKLHHLQPPGQLPLGVGEHLAVLAADEAGQLVPVLLHQLLEAEHHPRPHQRRGLGPVGEGALGAGDGIEALGSGGEGHSALLLAGGRIEDGAETLAAALYGFTVDEVVDPVTHKSSVMGHSRHPCARPWASGTGRGRPAGAMQSGETLFLGLQHVLQQSEEVVNLAALDDEGG